MKLITLATLAAVVGFPAIAARLERDALNAQAVELSLAERQDYPPQALQVVHNASSLFGWELAGALQTPDKLKPVCKDITTLGHGRWVQVGLIPADVQAPICKVQNTVAGNVLPNVDVYITGIFVTQILNAFTPGDLAPLKYLCTNLRYRPLNAFDIDANTVFDQVCYKAGANRPALTAAILDNPDQKAIQAYHNTASIVYAVELASGAATAAQLKDLCTNFATYDASKGTATLNSTQIRKTLCGFTQPLAIADASAMIKKYSTLGFIAQIENASNVPGYLKWLCDNLNSASLAQLGLDQDAVKTQICADASSNRRFDTSDSDRVEASDSLLATRDVSLTTRDAIEDIWGRGDMTWFPTGLGACGWTFGDHDRVVAVSKEIFDRYTPGGNPNKNPMCGRKVGIQGADGHNHFAVVADRCKDCKANDLDLPRPLFTEVTGWTDGRKPGVLWWIGDH